jgi:hypothetical protein
MGVIFSIFAALNALIHSGEVQLRGGGSVSLLAVLFSYLIMGPATGALIGLCFPLMRARVGAYALGVLTCLPLALFVATALSSSGPSLNAEVVFVSSAMALTLGGIGGLIVRELASE